MEMIDVLTRLKEIAESKPELVKDAVENVERTNPEAVTEGGMKDYLHGEAEKMSRKEFLAKHGESLRGFYDAINGSEDDEGEEAKEGKIPAGLKAYQDKKAGKEEKKETVKEDKIEKSADNADQSDEKGSPVASDNKPVNSANAKELAKGGAEEKGRPAPTAQKMSDFENRPGKDKYTSMKKEVKPATAEGSDKSAKSPVASK